MKLLEISRLLSLLGEGIDIHGLARLHRGEPGFEEAVKDYRSTLQGRKKELLKPFGLDDLDKFKENPEGFVKAVGNAVGSFKAQKEQKSLYKKLYEDDRCLITMPKGPEGAAAAGSFYKDNGHAVCPWCVATKYPDNEKWWKFYEAVGVFFLYSKRDGEVVDAACMVMRAEECDTTLKGNLDFFQMEDLSNKGNTANKEARMTILKRFFDASGFNEQSLLKVLKPALTTLLPAIERGLNEARLRSAAAKDDLDTVRQLLKAGVDVNACDGLNSSALIKAAHWASIEMCRLLINAGADVNIKEKKREMSALRYALEKEDDLELCWLLVKAGADPDTTDYNSGRTLLMLAAAANDEVLCMDLIDEGANVNALDYGGNSALSLAKNEGNDYICELLKSKGAIDDDEMTVEYWTTQV